jgi:hypothetical protein
MRPWPPENHTLLVLSRCARHTLRPCPALLLCLGSLCLVVRGWPRVPCASLAPRSPCSCVFLFASARPWGRAHLCPCVLPCRAVPCRAVPCRAVRCRAVPCRAVPCRAVPCRAVPCRASVLPACCCCQVENCNASSSCCDGYNASAPDPTASCTLACSTVARLRPPYINNIAMRARMFYPIPTPDPSTWLPRPLPCWLGARGGGGGGSCVVRVRAVCA